ncbi:MAG TPA: glycoside hydrolase family 2 TIM barrel-domain containing protein [Blastocatellia bacterium]|jgi:hypothetical protein|nr:glycoside hydrolase family 2 TIM barrel-domain containing protein [Blastocatellia bacterium]
MSESNIRRAFRAVVAAAMLLAAEALASGQTINLERGWQFLADKQGSLKPGDLAGAGGWRDARVGLSWNAQFEDLRDYMGVAWYRAGFDLPQLNSSRRALIRFGAVDYFAEVFLNGKLIGTHEGGYTPFSFDATEAARQGPNELLVRVTDPPMDEKENRARFPEMMYNEIPHGKQNWYVQTGGIWQPVRVDIKPALHIKDVRVTAKTDGSLSVRVETSRPLNPPPAVRRADSLLASGGQNITELQVRVLDPSGKAFDLRAVGGGGAGGAGYANFQARIPGPRLWGVDQPNLYTIEAKLGEDRFIDRFGFRSFEARDGKLYLNGEPFYMIAALDQDFYPDTTYTPPSEDYVRDMMLKARRLGLNMLRCHIKVPDPVYLKVADEVGLLVWYEIPSWNDFNHFSPKAAARGEKIFAEMVARDWNHPCVVIQSIINEGWGADLKQADQRKWLKEAFDRAKELTAPLGRLIVDNSACCDNFHVKTDIEDNHRYNSIPDYHAEFDRWVADFASRPKWNFSPHGDGERTGREPLILSEFGNWGLPRLPERLPWWFGRDFAGREVTRPAGVLDRFKQFKFDDLFKDFNELAAETQRHQFISLKHEIEEIRRHGPIQGYVITEFTDINWEVNGLMDMWRNPKVYAAELAKIQQPDVILARPAKRNYLSGERVEIETLLSHYGGKHTGGARVHWSTGSGAKGSYDLDREIERATVATLQPISFVAPAVTRPLRERLALEVRGRDGSLIAENSYDYFVFPKPKADVTAAIVFHDPANSSAGLGRALAAAGYKVSTGGDASAGALMISPSLDDAVKRHLEGGGRAIILIDSKEALGGGGSLKVAARQGSDLDGNWVTNFNWVRAGASPFNDVAVTRLLGFDSARAIPRYVIQGVRGEDYSDVMSGIFYGWLNNNAALAVQAQAGKGKLFATTFRFGEYGVDPWATHLLDGIIRHASGPRFSPKLKMQ